MHRSPGVPTALPAGARIGVLSPGMLAIPSLAAFLPEASVVAPLWRLGRRVDAVAGWGLKPSSRPARAAAARLGVPYLAVEDGFFRSVGLGEAGARPVSLIVDDLGVYYDARGRSRLEALLEGSGWESADLRARAEAAIALKNRTHLSKTNRLAAAPGPVLPPRTRPRVLVIDQTLGDASISGGLAGPESFSAMAAAARAEHPGAEIVVKTHPAVAAGLKQGCLPPGVAAAADHVVTDCNPVQLLGEVDTVYTVTSQLGFEALLLGLPVHCFGMPFYAGWGATQDRLTCARRTRRRDAADIFAAACLLLPRYVDPVTGTACPAEQALSRLVAMRARSTAMAGAKAVVGIAYWKRPPVRAALHSATGTTRFAGSLDTALRLAVDRPDGRIIVWGGRERGALRDRLAALKRPVVRMEDGFIRSAGLGSDFIAPASYVLDDLGIYYDATRPSRLETLINEGGFAPDLLARAAALRARLVAARISKYNLGDTRSLPDSGGRPRVLVVGQVESDASIRFGAGDVRTNAGLLTEARAAFPGAFVLYKEHPDVAAGNRSGAIAPEALARDADAVLREGDITGALDWADIVVTMTSLAGFEALLRGRQVICLGLPFYAGWGLTEDRMHTERRTRRASLDELVAAALIVYPLYTHPRTHVPCEVEDVLDAIAAARAVPARLPAQFSAGRAVRRFAQAVRLKLLPPRIPPGW